MRLEQGGERQVAFHVVYSCVRSKHMDLCIFQTECALHEDGDVSLEISAVSGELRTVPGM